MAFTKQYQHDKSKDIFETYKELALTAAKNNLTSKELIKLYFANLREAEIWNTVQTFIATISDIKIEEVEGGFKTAHLEYEVRSGKENAEINNLRIGILSSDKTAPVNKLCTKIKENKGKLAQIYKGYYENNGSEFVVLVDIDILNNPKLV